MKKFKKIGAFVLVVVMMLALSVSAFADPIGEAGTVGSKSEELTTATEVTFKNILKVYNPDETTIYAPAVTFAYTIEANTAAADGVGKTVTDSDSVVGFVLSGAGGTITAGSDTISYTVTGTPTITASVAYTMADEVTAAADGADNEQTVTVSFSGVTFSKPGIYRYKITRTITDENSALESSDEIVRYLDVYVKEVVSGETASRVIYGYVLHDITDDITTSSTTKYDSFDSEYKTSNLIVSKTLVGDSLMNNHKFPFSVTFDSTKAAHIKTSVTGTATVGTLAAGATTDAPAVANGGSVKYIGIPNGFTATVYETNDVTGTSYKSEGAADTAAAAKVINWTGDTAKSNNASSAAATDVTKTVAFTNTLELISPTGVVMRVAPYVMILTAGLALLLVSKRGRREEA